MAEYAKRPEVTVCTMVRSNHRVDGVASQNSHFTNPEIASWSLRSFSPEIHGFDLNSLYRVNRMTGKSA
jgi:hypothetical protein